MIDDGFIPFMISQEVFDHLAAMDGQVRDEFKIHSVDKEAGTLRVGGVPFKAMKPITFAPINGDVREIESSKTRGAQWKRENNRHRRSW